MPGLSKNGAPRAGSASAATPEHPLVANPLLRRSLGLVKGTFVIAEWMDEGSDSPEPRLIAPLHLHHKDEEAWYVVEGELCIRVGAEIIRAPTGTAVVVPPGTPHTFWNPLSSRTRYVIVMTRRIHEMIQALHQLPERNQQTVAALFREYDSELL